MLRTYKAILRGDRVKWLDQPPELTEDVPVEITVLEHEDNGSSDKRGASMAEALTFLAGTGAFEGISDPVTWQRELRHERTLPNRES